MHERTELIEELEKSREEVGRVLSFLTFLTLVATVFINDLFLIVELLSNMV